MRNLLLIPVMSGLVVVALSLFLPPEEKVAAQGPELLDSLPDPPEGMAWRLVWHDEFEGTEVDQTKWAFPPPAPRRDG
ncbi:MAG TPA: hypothetical protein P5568_14500, partial [Acidobacteriota bacterium]|nr:hypothetical protein [Acidobacteriota bacterium]